VPFSIHNKYKRQQEKKNAFAGRALAACSFGGHVITVFYFFKSRLVQLAARLFIFSFYCRENRESDESSTFDSLGGNKSNI
jgi:hypothetical protein